jgi:putative ABC transport system permease protein
MRWLPLLLANLRRRPLRLVFTLGSIVVAFWLFALLEALRSGFATSISMVGVDRLMTLNKTSIIQPLPFAHFERVKAVPGVAEVSFFHWFGGVFRDGRTQIPVYVCDPESFLRVYPELQLQPGVREAWLADRQGVLVGSGVAARYGIRVGDRIPMRSAIYRQRDGGDVWEMNVSGIYDIAEGAATLDRQSFFFHYDYFNESIRAGRDRIGWMVVRVADPERSTETAARIDAAFENSSSETKTSTEKAMARQFADQVGNIGAILVAVVGAVFFTMMLVTANTMAQAVRERTPEIAVLKTLGFRSAQVMWLVLAESLLVTALGGILGLALGAASIAAIGPGIRQFIPVFEMTGRAVALAALLMLAFGTAAGAWPAAGAMRLRITEALRHT